MNSIHNNGKTGETLQEDLDKISRAYGKLEQTEPPDLLDQAILNSAHRAVEKKPHWMKFGWLHGMTTVAIVGLAISLILKQPETTPVMKDTSGINGDTPVLQESMAVKPAMEKPAVETGKIMESRRDEPTGRTEDLAAAPPADAEDATEEQSRSTTGKGQLATLNDKVPVKEFRTHQKDNDRSVIMKEQAPGDEADVLPELTARQLNAQETTPTTAAEPMAKELEEQSGTELSIEQQLKDIILLKEAGDESWMAELEKFRLKYPDYPLPAELRP